MLLASSSAVDVGYSKQPLPLRPAQMLRRVGLTDLDSALWWKSIGTKLTFLSPEIRRYLDVDDIHFRLKNETLVSNLRWTKISENLH